MASNRLLTCKFCKKFEGAWGQTASKHWKLFPIQKNSDGTPVLTNRGHVMADTGQNPHECFGHAPIPQGEEPRGRHPKTGRDLVAVKSSSTVTDVVEKIVYWVYRRAWSGRLLSDQMDELQFEKFREEIWNLIPDDEKFIDATGTQT